MKENWLPCFEFEDYYMVSDLGRVLNIKKNKIIALTKAKGNSNGAYLRVKLTKEKKHYSLTAHRLVAHTFLGKSELSVNHINGIKDDNRLVNLEYATLDEQNLHAEKLNIRPYKSKRQVLLYNNSFNENFMSIKDAARFINSEKGVSVKYAQSNLTHVLNGRMKSVYGFNCKYIN
jgi:hypothetical protein